MSITLSVGGTTLNLSPDLYWSDENNWHPVEQSVSRSITGALIIQPQAREAGRPITLEPEDDQSAHMPLSTVTQLRNWAEVPGQAMTLTLRGIARTVIFRHQDGAAIEATPWVHYRDVQAGDLYRVVIRLMEI